jgi:hypothetical protein
VRILSTLLLFILLWSELVVLYPPFRCWHNCCLPTFLFIVLLGPSHPSSLRSWIVIFSAASCFILAFLLSLDVLLASLLHLAYCLPHFHGHRIDSFYLVNVVLLLLLLPLLLICVSL